MKERSSNETNIAIIMNDIQYIKKDVADIKLQLHADYVTRSEFDPVKRVVYGLVSVILLPVVAAIVAIVLR